MLTGTGKWVGLIFWYSGNTVTILQSNEGDYGKRDLIVYHNIWYVDEYNVSKLVPIDEY